jgi:hypothetical protein
VYKKLVVKNDTLVGAVLYGDTADGAWYFQLVKDGQNIREMRDHLMFGQNHVGDVGHAGKSKAAAMPDEAEVCGCNGVCKGTSSRRSRPGPVHARRRAQAHQGLQLLRLLHRPGRADPRLDHRRRLHAGGYQGQAGVRLHRPFARRGAPDHPRTATC